jgi:cysteine desulfurase / selenocysteine lyase
MIFFNNGATSFPKPKAVTDAVSEYIKSVPYHSARAGLDDDVVDDAHGARDKIGKLFNTKDTDQIVFTSGSTEALNLAINGIDLKGGHVVSTAIEHNSVIRPLMHLKEAGDIEVDFVKCNEHSEVALEDIKAAMRDNTRAIVVNHSSNVTGSILDLKGIAKIAHDNDAVIIVDASQSSGAIPIDVTDWDVDYLAFTGHKSMFGLQGIGGLYIKKGNEPKPLKVGGTGIKSHILVQPPGMPIYYEAGTPNMPGIVSLNAGVGFVLEQGVENIQKHKQDMVQRIINELSDVEAVTHYVTSKHNSYANFCFTVRGMVPEEVGYVLESSYDIAVRTGLHCAPLLLEPVGVHPWGTVRASPSFFTTDDQIDLFIKAIKETVKTFVK